jgi:uncharacterized protein
MLNLIKLNKFLIILVFILYIFNINILAHKFGPWNSNVTTGDDKIKYFINQNKETNIKHKKILALHQIRFRTIFNGVQGGAYFLIRFWQVVISPQDGPNCRFHPVCSAYGKHAVEKHGALFGGFMAGERLIRCNPFNPPGHDPVPDNILEKK